MATYKCPPQKPSGAGTFSDNLVGLQLVQGGGLTQGNFTFTTGIASKTNREFDTGIFSDPISLTTLGTESVQKSLDIFSKNFRIKPNFDQTNVLNFTSYGPLSKRLSDAVQGIINYFPAALEISKYRTDFTTGYTASGITYFSDEDVTKINFEIDLINNPFQIDFTTNSTSNIENYDYDVSVYRNFTEKFLSYILEISGSTYNVVNFIPTANLNSGNFTLYIKGNPFSGQTTIYESFIIRLNDTIINEVYNLELDEVQEILLNRQVTPKYTAKFQVPIIGDDGTVFTSFQTITWPLNGIWNIDISSNGYLNYIEKLQEIAFNFDQNQTNLIARFYITQAFPEFDTSDQKVDKVLKIYGRSFDETKKYIDGIQTVVSVNYNIGDDIPSQLLPNLAQTLGWGTNISPITNKNYLDSLYGTTKNAFPAYSTSQTINDLNYQYYRNLILNSAYLFKSKGTRKSIEFLMNFIGVPNALLEFNENVYLADSNIDLGRFDELFAQIEGGTLSESIPSYDDTKVYNFYGNKYTGYTASTSTIDVSATIEDYPFDSEGYPKAPTNTNEYFFQQGEGWYESTPQHRSLEVLDTTNSVFIGNTFSAQTSLEPFTYGQKYLERFRKFPFMNLGFNLKIQNDNKKSWSSADRSRISRDGIYNSYYIREEDRLTLNVKNTEICLNPAQALVYDVWYLSRTQNYPIPYTGLSTPYPQPGGVDSTFIDPKPQIDTFYEFSRTFWRNMINVRNRMSSSDGKTSGYPTLQSIYWKYLTSYQDVQIQNDNFNYQNMISYINGIGDFWIKLIDQFVPATTLWTTGIKFENSIFHRQKFIYRRQRGCQTATRRIPNPIAYGTLQSTECVTHNYEISTPQIPQLQSIVTTAVNQISSAQSCTTFNVLDITYGFSFTFSDGTNVTNFEYIGDKFYNPQIIPTITEWNNLIAQGINYLTQEFNAVGIVVEFNEDLNLIYITSYSDNYLNGEVGDFKVITQINMNCN